ncbi:hypothetical protein A4H97_16165 [Niastella yeongjuensis]|uniref:Uncharacterized protein n=1 Tax=Niastella yeongjuensis TaxID=354355 RepID=A0A1V9E103_9BACT|nr:hypothetical protein A4H97_16165 [Niastella yeongjuensis]
MISIVIYLNYVIYPNKQWTIRELNRILQGQNPFVVPVMSLLCPCEVLVRLWQKAEGHRAEGRGQRIKAVRERQWARVNKQWGKCRAEGRGQRAEGKDENH